MFSLVKAAYNLFSNANKEQKLKELFEKECDYLDDLIEKEQIQENWEFGDNSCQSSNLTTQIKETECSTRIGTITKLKSDCGFIDDTIYFDMEDVTGSVKNLKLGDKIKYLLYRNPKTEHLIVKKIESLAEDNWDNQSVDNVDDNKVATDNEESPQYFTTCQRNIIGTVVEKKDECLTVETEYSSLEFDTKLVKCECLLKLGDRVYICCKVQNDEGFVDRQGEILEILSVFPARTITHEIRTVRQIYTDWVVLNEECYMTFDVMPPDFKCNIGDVLKCDIIECERGLYNWRCIRADVVKSAENSVSAEEVANQNKKTHYAITVSENPTCIFGGLEQKQIIKVNVTNNLEHPMQATGITFPKRPIKLISLTDAADTENGFELPSKSSYEVRFTVESKFFGESRESFTIQFDTFNINRTIFINVCASEEMAEKMRERKKNLSILQVNRYNATSDIKRSCHRSKMIMLRERQVIPGVNLFARRRFVANRIPAFEIPCDLRNVYLSNMERYDCIDYLENKCPCLKEQLSFNNYVKYFGTLLFLEEIGQFVNFRKYDMDRGSFRHEGEYLALTIKNLSERRPSLVIGDSVRVTNPFLKNAPIFEGVIHKVFAERILLKFIVAFHATYRHEDYRIEFFFSRFTFRKSHCAIERIHKNLSEQFLFPDSVSERRNPQLTIQLGDDLMLYNENKKLPWYNSNLNEFQKRAVFNVLRGETNNMPYVIFGPPGTGKTITIIEIILQLLKHAKQARVLVGAPSNSVANLIATRLIESDDVVPGDFVRLVSHNLIEQDLIPEQLMPYCATIDIGIDGSCKNEMTTTASGLKLRCQSKYLGQHRITIGTCSTLGNYLQMKFPDNQFSHVIIDEAGQCIEPEIMIPISQVARTNGQVVLAGDHKQLQPIVVDRYASHYGLSLSYLERILARLPYQRNSIKFPKSCGYDPRLVTKLLYNYRALPSILNIYNSFFYCSELIAVIDEHNSKEAESLRNISKELFPVSDKRPKTHGVFFQGIRSKNQQDNDSPSWYNALEARSVFLWTVKLYRQNINANNIGIITPYARQVKYIRNMFKTANVELPKIGTVEEFQGQERDIILISTVRSSTRLLPNDVKFTLGFVSCEKRMNVAISRARYLMIVFGNPHLLCVDPQWRKFIKICVDNDAYEGCDLPTNLDDPGSIEKDISNSDATTEENSENIEKDISNSDDTENPENIDTENSENIEKDISNSDDTENSENIDTENSENIEKYILNSDDTENSENIDNEILNSDDTETSENIEKYILNSDDITDDDSENIEEDILNAID